VAEGRVSSFLADFAFFLPGASLRFAAIAVECLDRFRFRLLATCKSGLFFAASTRDCCAEVAGMCSAFATACSCAVALAAVPPGPLKLERLLVFLMTCLLT
jgi:hypothetical protein